MEAWVAWLMGLFRSEHIEFALFAAAFISATVLPGGSEAVLAGAVAGTPSRVVEFVLIAMLGNALGGMTGWCIGRFIPERKKEGKALAWLHKYGYWALLMTAALWRCAAYCCRMAASQGAALFPFNCIGQGAALCGGGRRGAAACRLTAQKAV